MSDTRSKIENALIELARIRDVDKLTVKDITDHAHISRQTFYNHYHDLPDVMEQILRRSKEQLIERSISAETAEEILALFVDEMERGYGVLRRVLHSSFRAGAERVLLDAAREIVSAIFQEKYALADLSAGEAEFITDISACMTMTYLLEHFEKQDVDREEICGRFLWLIETLVRTDSAGI